MDDVKVRAALYAAAGEQCSQVRLEGDEPCYQCRQVARDIVLRFLSEVGDLQLISPLELRVRLLVEGSDG